MAEAGSFPVEELLLICLQVDPAAAAAGQAAAVLGEVLQDQLT